jgi:hypothetical protein
MLLVRRREAEMLAAERLANLTDEAVTRLEALLSSDDDRVALRAACEVLDRVLGRPRQPHEHSGHLGLDIDMTVVRSKVARMLDQKASAMAGERPHDPLASRCPLGREPALQHAATYHASAPIAGVRLEGSHDAHPAGSRIVPW